MNTTELPRFGIEIETVGLSKSRVAAAIQTVVGGIVREDSYRENATVTAADGRSWNVVHDGSLSGNENGEIVSPILTYADLETLQSVVRAVRAAGARADESCGIHIHIDGGRTSETPEAMRFDVRAVLNLVNMVHKHERLIERALDVRANRRGYCKAIDDAFVARLESAKPKTLDELRVAWYGADTTGHRYHASRYHAINLNSLFYRGTIEFRYFNGTLHAGEVKSYVQLCLSLASRALKTKKTSRARRVVETYNERWAFRGFLKILGMLGPEFKTARTFLTKNLEGKSNRTKPTEVAPG